MPILTQLRDYLKTRRSVGSAFLRDPGPSEDELREIVAIGTRVPDHGKLTPWRLVVIDGDGRARAGAKLAEIAQRRHPEYDEAALGVERTRFLPAPVTIGIISRPGPHEKVPEFEQLLSAGNVAFNLLNAAYALGYAANWTTRWYAFDDDAAKMLGARDGERFIGFVAIGTPTATIDDRPRPAFEDVVTRWQG